MLAILKNRRFVVAVIVGGVLFVGLGFGYWYGVRSVKIGDERVVKTNKINNKISPMVSGKITTIEADKIIIENSIPSRGKEKKAEIIKYDLMLNSGTKYYVHEKNDSMFYGEKNKEILKIKEQLQNKSNVEKNRELIRKMAKINEDVRSGNYKKAANLTIQINKLAKASSTKPEELEKLKKDRDFFNKGYELKEIDKGQLKIDDKIIVTRNEKNEALKIEVIN